MQVPLLIGASLLKNWGWGSFLREFDTSRNVMNILYDVLTEKFT